MKQNNALTRLPLFCFLKRLHCKLLMPSVSKISVFLCICICICNQDSSVSKQRAGWLSDRRRRPFTLHIRRSQQVPSHPIIPFLSIISFVSFLFFFTLHIPSTSAFPSYYMLKNVLFTKRLMHINFWPTLVQKYPSFPIHWFYYFIISYLLILRQHL